MQNEALQANQTTKSFGINKMLCPNCKQPISTQEAEVLKKYKLNNCIKCRKKTEKPQLPDGVQVMGRNIVLKPGVGLANE
jgi:NAD-dependent SIR2 family protein deacetylase